MINLKELFQKSNLNFLNISKFFSIKSEKAYELQSKLAKIIVTSYDPEELKNKIVRELALSLDASRCFFIEYDSATNNFKKITNAYNTKRSASSLLSFNIEETIPNLAIKRKYMKFLVIDDTEKFIRENKLEKSNEEKYFQDYDVKALMSVRLEYGEEFLGVLGVHYDKKKKFLKGNELKFLTNVAEHISIALYLSKLYAEEKGEKEKEKILRAVITVMSQEYDLDLVTKRLYEVLRSIYFTQNIFISVNIENFKRTYFQNSSINSSKNIEECKKKAIAKIYDLPGLKQIKDKGAYVENTHNFIIQNNLEGSSVEKYFNKNNIKSFIIQPIVYEYSSYGTLTINFESPNALKSEDVSLIKTVTSQLAIAIKQAYNYDKEKKIAQREALLRKNFETMRSSLDINVVKDQVVTGLGKEFDADRCFIMEYDSKSDKFLPLESEYLSSDKIEGFSGTDLNIEIPNLVMELKKGKILIFNENGIKLGNEYIDPRKGFEKELEITEKYKINSSLAFPLYYSKSFIGDLVLHYVDKKHFINEDEINLINIFAEQIAVALHQASMYKTMQLQAEREKLNRNILEILRNAMDKGTIKSLFVKNIGKYFNADRVLFCEYDAAEKMYLPADENAEYLSIPTQQSLIGYDWSNPEVYDFIQPLLEKREIHIHNLDKYEEKYPKSHEFINIMKALEIKSSYNFPVLYQQSIMGFFCIDFFDESRELSEEDIIRIRSMCTHAGIALYQAELYKQAKETAMLREKLIEKTLNEMQTPLKDIGQISEILSTCQMNCDQEYQYLTKLNNNVKELTHIIQGILN